MPAGHRANSDLPIAKSCEDGYSLLMIGFFIKKAFFDSWDNLISLVLLNLTYLVVILSFYGGLELFAISGVWGIVVIALAMALHSTVVGAVNVQAKAYADYSRPGFSHFFHAFRSIWRHAAIHWIISMLTATMMLIVIPFYLSYDSIFAFTVAVFVFWIVLAFTLAMMYFFPLAVHMRADGPMKTVKKSFMIVADNLGFSLFFGIYHVVNLVLTVVFATIIPGISGIELSRQVAVKLLMFKYDYLEKHPGVGRKDIPWEELLFDEREKVGKRTFRGMIFPWKE